MAYMETTDTTDPADRTHFVLSPEAYDEFVALLDKDPEPSPKLVALFSTPTRFER